MSSDELHVSTITAISEINTDIDLEKLYHNIPIDEYITFIQYGNDNHRGYSHKLMKKKRKHKERKSFYNCCTLHVYEDIEYKIRCPKDMSSGDIIQKKVCGEMRDFKVPEGILSGDIITTRLKKIINIKIFNNGKIQMTGLKYEKHGMDIIIKILPYFNKIFDRDDLKILTYKIVLINCDFEFKDTIDRYKLHNQIVNFGYYSSYEPCSYPGVNIKYYINTNNKDGICCCDSLCNGKGNGDGDGDCKRVTIAVFKSGSTIITGGQNFQQIDCAYQFICDFIKYNMGD